MPWTWDTEIEPSGQVITRQIVGETVLIPTPDHRAGTQQVLVLDPRAAHIWRALAAGRPLTSIRDELPGWFDIDPEQAAADLKDFVARLLEAGLLVPVRSLEEAS